MKKKSPHEMDQNLARNLLGMNPLDNLPDDPELKARLVTLANKKRQGELYRVLLPVMVEMSDAGVTVRVTKIFDGFSLNSEHII